MLLYAVGPGIVLLLCCLLFWAVARFTYRLGVRFRGAASAETGSAHLPDAIPAGIQATLALILGFTYSMAVGRFEQRRQLVIDEANQINSTWQQSQALRSGREEITALFGKYLDARIEYYEKRPGGEEARQVDEKTSRIEKQIWDQAYLAARKDRGAIENGFLLLLNEMSDLRLARNFALLKTMPREIYLVILLLCMAAIGATNYARGVRGEVGRWQPAIGIAVVALVFALIVDIDQPTLGGINISQDAMLAVRRDLPSGGAAGKAPSLQRPTARGKHR